jgi:hypothetical protein
MGAVTKPSIDGSDLEGNLVASAQRAKKKAEGWPFKQHVSTKLNIAIVGSIRQGKNRGCPPRVRLSRSRTRRGIELKDPSKNQRNACLTEDP